MTGLNLETFLQLLRVAPGAWASLGVATVILALMTWTSWGSRRVLRKCLFLSIAAHIVMIFYGGSSPEIQRFFRLGSRPPRPEPAIERIKVISIPDPERPDRASPTRGQSSFRPASPWNQRSGALALAEPDRAVPRPDRADTPASPDLEPPKVAEPIAPPVAAPEAEAVEPAAPELPRRPAGSPSLAAEPAAEPVAPGEESVVPPAAPPEPTVTATPTRGLPIAATDLRTRSRPRPAPDLAARAASPGRASPARAATVDAPALPTAMPAAVPERDLIAPAVTPEVADPGRLLAAVPTEPAGSAPLPPDDPPPGLPDEPAPSSAPAPSAAATPGLLPEIDIRRSIRPGRPATGATPAPRPTPTRPLDPAKPGAGVGSLAQATPSLSAATAVAALPRAIGRRPLAEIPPVYRSRLDPNRSALAQRAGASPASEQAVERALAWLAVHQDADGRWDGGTVKYKDGHVADTDDTFTAHCPAGDICFGECYYGEADTALTGLSLLAYLGAGYTHVDGKYKDAVGRGIGFLRQSQKPDGDLRGSSLAVGMYCHAMATLALCEAYALTGDPALQLPVERGIGFLVRARAVDGMAWRYAPGAATGDTSILGWAVMALKSAKTVGIAIPPPIQSGIAAWLKQVADGPSGGLARYQPGAGTKVTPTMTAEAWACRQFLELGGPGPTSDEAAASLLANPSDRGQFNVYYLYYGTLAMYQHGGPAWTAWNARVRDRVVAEQQTSGHKAGSWDPDSSPYGSHGGRIYCTALATLTLEVYYRFLRLYSTPDGATPLAPRPADPAARRAGLIPPRAAAGR